VAEGLGLEPVDSYLRLMPPLKEEIRVLSLKLRHIASEDEDVRLLTTIPGVSYYTAVLVKAEVGDIARFRTGGSALQLRGSGPVHLQQRRRHPPRTHHQGGLGVDQVGDGGGGSHPPEVRHADDPGLPPDCGAPGQEDGEGGGGQDAPRGLSVCVEE
jgi:hypothetical protein